MVSTSRCHFFFFFSFPQEDQLSAEDRASYIGLSRLAVLHETALGAVANMGAHDFPLSPAGTPPRAVCASAMSVAARGAV